MTSKGFIVTAALNDDNEPVVVVKPIEDDARSTLKDTVFSQLSLQNRARSPADLIKEERELAKKIFEERFVCETKCFLLIVFDCPGLDPPSKPVNSRRKPEPDVASSTAQGASADAGDADEVERMLERELPHVPPTTQAELVADIKKLSELFTQGLLSEIEARFYAEQLKILLEKNSADMDEEDLSKKRGRGGDDHGTKDSVNLEDL